jgi:tetratricopeptide (TPR) repeat protein
VCYSVSKTREIVQDGKQNKESMREFVLRRKIKKYERKIEAHADDPVYLQELAQLYRQISEEEAAIAYYQKSIEAYYQDDSRLGVNNEFILEVCWTLLELDPKNVLAHQTLGQEYCSLGEFEEAAKLYKSFAAKLAKAGQYHDAISQYRNALVLFPDDIKGRQNCFSLLWKLRRKEEAVQELKKIAEIAESKGYIAKAVECYQKALKIMPANAELQQELRRLIQTHRRGHSQLRLVVNNDA